MLAAITVVGENQREHAEQLRVLSEGQRQPVEAQRQLAEAHRETGGRVRSIEEGLAEMRDLLVRALERPQ